jgi:hypothetical protein
MKSITVASCSWYFAVVLEAFSAPQPFSAILLEILA